MSNNKIQVIMLMDVKNIGRKNEILNVAPAYAKNVLLAKKYAVIANQQMIDKLSNDKAKKQAGQKDHLQDIETMVQSLKDSGLSISNKVSPAGKLYAKIDAKAIASALSEQYGYSVESSMLTIDKIDSIGDYSVKIQYGTIRSSFTLSVKGVN